MKITVIGSGSAYGVPAVGGYWGDCDPSNPKNKRTAPSILVEKDKTQILVDLSPDFREQSIRHQITTPDAVLFTHSHADHIMGNFHIPKMMMYYPDTNLPLYALPETQSDIEKVFYFQHNAGNKTKFSGAGRPVWETITPYTEFTVGDLTVMPLDQDHGRIRSLGFRFGNFAYSTDFNTLPEKTYDGLTNLDCWLVECNSLTRNNSPEFKHQYLENVLDFIDRVKPKKTYLTHMDTSMDYDTVTAILPPHVHLAYDGLEIDL